MLFCGSSQDTYLIPFFSKGLDLNSVQNSNISLPIEGFSDNRIIFGQPLQKLFENKISGKNQWLLEKAKLYCFSAQNKLSALLILDSPFLEISDTETEASQLILGRIIKCWQKKRSTSREIQTSQEARSSITLSLAGEDFESAMDTLYLSPNYLDSFFLDFLKILLAPCLKDVQIVDFTIFLSCTSPEIELQTLIVPLLRRILAKEFKTDESAFDFKTNKL